MNLLLDREIFFMDFVNPSRILKSNKFVLKFNFLQKMTFFYKYIFFWCKYKEKSMNLTCWMKIVMNVIEK